MQHNTIRAAARKIVFGLGAAALIAIPSFAAASTGAQRAMFFAHAEGNTAIASKLKGGTLLKSAVLAYVAAVRAYYSSLPQHGGGYFASEAPALPQFILLSNRPVDWDSTEGFADPKKDVRKEILEEIHDEVAIVVREAQNERAGIGMGKVIPGMPHSPDRFADFPAENPLTLEDVANGSRTVREELCKELKEIFALLAKALGGLPGFGSVAAQLAAASQPGPCRDLKGEFEGALLGVGGSVDVPQKLSDAASVFEAFVKQLQDIANAADRKVKEIIALAINMVDGNMRMVEFGDGFGPVIMRPVTSEADEDKLGEEKTEKIRELRELGKQYNYLKGLLVGFQYELERVVASLRPPTSLGRRLPTPADILDAIGQAMANAFGRPYNR